MVCHGMHLREGAQQNCQQSLWVQRLSFRNSALTAILSSRAAHAGPQGFTGVSCPVRMSGLGRPASEAVLSCQTGFLSLTFMATCVKYLSTHLLVFSFKLACFRREKRTQSNVHQKQDR